LRQRQEAREEEEKKRQEEAQKKRDEELKQVEAEFEEWKDLISIDQKGSQEDESAADGEGALARFVEYIQRRKVVTLEELAIDFGLSDAQTVLDRIRLLEEAGRISGLVDDRGKYIHITKEEMEGVAAYIESAGRVTIHDIVEQSNKLIDLEGQKDETEAIDLSLDEDEEKKA
jgi:DDRGK domain-containing protein 1